MKNRENIIRKYLTYRTPYMCVCIQIYPYTHIIYIERKGENRKPLNKSIPLTKRAMQLILTVHLNITCFPSIILLLDINSRNFILSYLSMLKTFIIALLKLPANAILYFIYPKQYCQIHYLPFKTIEAPLSYKITDILRQPA